MAQLSVACNTFADVQTFSERSNAEGVRMDEGASTSRQDSENQSLSFSVGFEEPPKKPRRLPKNLRVKRKPELSEASIAEKQMQAEKRRKKHIEDKLDKIHQLEEEAQRLAQAMIPLIEASSLTNGQSSRKLHSDNDVVRNITEDLDKEKLERNLGEHSSNGGGCSSGGDRANT